MKNIKIVTLFILAALAFSACDPKPHSRHVRHNANIVVKHEKARHLKNGRYAYYDNGFIYYYMYMDSSSNISYYTTQTSVNSLPNGGSWVKGEAEGESDFAGFAIDGQDIENVSVESNISTGDPISVSEAAAETAQGFSGEGYDSGQSMADGDHATSDSSSTDSSASSASSDSGSSASSDGGSSGGGGDPE